MVVKTLKLGNTIIEVDDTYMPKTKEENDKAFEEVNRVACRILRDIYE